MCLHVDSTSDEVVHGCYKLVIGVISYVISVTLTILWYEVGYKCIREAL